MLITPHDNYWVVSPCCREDWDWHSQCPQRSGHHHTGDGGGARTLLHWQHPRGDHSVSPGQDVCCGRSAGHRAYATPSRSVSKVIKVKSFDTSDGIVCALYVCTFTCTWESKYKIGWDRIVWHGFIIPVIFNFVISWNLYCCDCFLYVALCWFQGCCKK